MLTDYNKIIYKYKKETIVMQPKSYTGATKAEKTEVLELLMTGEYVMVLAAMPAAILKEKIE